MNTTTIRAIATAAALAGTAALSQAATVNFTGWAFGSGNSVTVGAPNHSGPAGGFKGSVVFNAAEQAAGWQDILNNNFISYCVEINEHFSLPSGNMSGYSVVHAASYVRSADNTVLGATAANRLGQLMSLVAADPQRVDTAAESTALQLAIWNLIYDTDSSLMGGTFTANANSFRTTGDTLLGAAATTGNRYEAYILTKSGSQDFLLLRELPEPTSLALSLLALGGLGIAAKRRAAKA